MTSIATIHEQLEKILTIRRTKGVPIDDVFLPGLSRESIAAQTQRLTFPFPDELYALYQWRNGIPVDSQFYFLFRDQRFLPLDEALEEYEMMLTTYASSDIAPIHPEIDLRMCFPFAGFEGALYVLPSVEHDSIEGHRQPVISVFEGVDVHFYSFLAMLATVIAWFEQGEQTEDGVSLTSECELKIWQAHNPGIFQ